MNNLRPFKERIEEKYGQNFSISMKEFAIFVQELIDEGYDEWELSKEVVTFFRCDIIDFNSLKDYFKYMGYILPEEFAFYSDKAKQVLSQAYEKVESDYGLYKYLDFLYQNDRIDFNVYKTCILLMNQKFTEEFEAMSEIERKTRLWITKDNQTVILSKETSDLIKCCESFREFEESEIFIPSKKYEYPMDFIFDYMDQKNIDDKTLTKSGLDRRKKSRLKTQIYWDKDDVFRFIFMLGMSITEAKQFMTLCGYTFSPLMETDLFVLDYLNGKYEKVKTLKELSDLCIKVCGVDLTFNEWL